MKPLTKIAETALPSGSLLELWERDGSYFLLEDGLQLSSSFSHGSDDAMVDLAVSPVKRANQPTILINGIGLGFHLARAIELMNKDKASFVVAEPCEELLEWNREHLDFLHPGMLEDPRVVLENMTSLALVRKEPKGFHAILIRSTHTRFNLTVAEASDYFASLKQGGLLLILLSKSDGRLFKTLQRAGFEVTTTSVPSSHKGKQTNFHTIIVAKKGRFVPFAQRHSQS